ncbi:hypothetical protein VB264_17455 [Arcicella aquatica]|uniref:Uncharacterized protein n=1 Tax=Arcicella aquatica TaxID=217141 RepID=A0ABU5QRX6_9BACT|nr:hypothetical protein [Arcicella aquatica]MEA5259589.1 hypothetical protein [Arcicella aquatica]
MNSTHKNIITPPCSFFTTQLNILGIYSLLLGFFIILQSCSPVHELTPEAKKSELLLKAQNLFKKQIASSTRKSSANPRDIDISKLAPQWEKNKIRKSLDSRGIDILQVFVKKDADQKWMIDYFILDGQEVLHLRKHTKHDGCLTTYNQQGQFLEKGKVNLKSNKYSKFLTRDMLMKSARVANMWLEQDANGNYYACSESGCIIIPVDGGSGDDNDDDVNDDDDDSNDDGDGDSESEEANCQSNQNSVQHAINNVIVTNESDIDGASNLASNINPYDRKDGSKEWVALRSLTYAIFSHENYTQVKKDSSSPWQWETITHSSLSDQGTIIGGTAEYRLNHFHSELGNYWANVKISLHVDWKPVCNLNPFPIGINYNASKSFHVDDQD